jgi:uncharacterized protein YdhG (YjbR/CyaY superfamily)
MTWASLSSPNSTGIRGEPWRTVKNVGVAGTTSAKAADDFLAAVPPDKRAALLRLRRTIKAAAPKAVELINYGVPMFRLGGKNQSPVVMRAFAAELKDYKQGKGSIQFAADRPLPAALVTKLVKARIAENGKAR